MSNFASEFNKDKESYAQQNSDWFKFKEGDNKIRILAEPAKLFEKFNRGVVYKGCDFATEATMKYLTYVLDYADNKIKTMKIPYSIMEQIVGFMTNPDYEFQTFPMPYDITVKATNAGTKEVSYVVIAARNNSDIDTDIIEKLSKKKTPVEVVDIMQENQIKKDKEAGIYKSPEERAEEMKAEIIKSRESRGAEPIETIEYPTDDINPNDIPF
jgi:hypothetical protein